jgi:hypothetical protein
MLEEFESDARFKIYQFLRDLALKVIGFEHFGGSYSGDGTMTIYCRKRK